MSELSYNPGADALFDKNLPDDFVSRRDEDMSKYPTIIHFVDQSLTIFSKEKSQRSIEYLIRKYNGRRHQFNTRPGRPIMVERIKEGEL